MEIEAFVTKRLFESTAAFGVSSGIVTEVYGMPEAKGICYVAGGRNRRKWRSKLKYLIWAYVLKVV